MVTVAMKSEDDSYWQESYDKLDTVLKSRDIPLLTKVRSVKAIAFPAVTYGCES